jgi:hypothetical protein
MLKHIKCQKLDTFVMRYEKGKDPIQLGPSERARKPTGVRKTA